MVAKLRDSQMDADDVLEELQQAQLILIHKKDVWILTTAGFKLSHFVLRQKREEQYPGLRIRKRP